MYYLIASIIVVGFILHIVRVKQIKMVNLNLYRPNTRSTLNVKVNLQDDDLQKFIVKNYPGWVICENLFTYVKPPWIH